jgi:glycosyltransferase involved in cell wall biosynthesis
MARVARLLAKEQGDAEVVDLNHKIHEIHEKGECGGSLRFSGERLEEVWVHGMWLPREWAVCWRVIKSGKRLVRMTHGSLSPVYLKRQSPIKKWLVGPIERWFLRKADRIVATCDAEKAWIEAYEPGVKKIEVVDIKRFFKLSRVERVDRVEGGAEKDELHLLYLGRRHPLKGVEFLETAVRQLQISTRSTRSTRLNIELRIVSNAKGEELDKVWEWCDVLVLPTLSENFGLVVAEALERGKRVITTDGAPVWESLVVSDQSLVVSGDGCGIGVGYGGRLIYLKGYRDGSDEKRVELLKRAISTL